MVSPLSYEPKLLGIRANVITKWFKTCSSFKSTKFLNATEIVNCNKKIRNSCCNHLENWMHFDNPQFSDCDWTQIQMPCTISRLSNKSWKKLFFSFSVGHKCLSAPGIWHRNIYIPRSPKNEKLLAFFPILYFLIFISSSKPHIFSSKMNENPWIKVHNLLYLFMTAAVHVTYNASLPTILLSLPLHKPENRRPIASEAEEGSASEANREDGNKMYFQSH